MKMMGAGGVRARYISNLKKHCHVLIHYRRFDALVYLNDLNIHLNQDESILPTSIALECTCKDFTQSVEDCPEECPTAKRYCPVQRTDPDFYFEFTFALPVESGIENYVSAWLNKLVLSGEMFSLRQKHVVEKMRDVSCAFCRVCATKMNAIQHCSSRRRHFSKSISVPASTWFSPHIQRCCSLSGLRWWRSRSRVPWYVQFHWRHPYQLRLCEFATIFIFFLKSGLRGLDLERVLLLKCGSFDMHVTSYVRWCQHRVQRRIWYWKLVHRSCWDCYSTSFNCSCTVKSRVHRLMSREK